MLTNKIQICFLMEDCSWEKARQYKCRHLEECYVHLTDTVHSNTGLESERYERGSEVVDFYTIGLSLKCKLTNQTTLQ